MEQIEQMEQTEQMERHHVNSRSDDPFMVPLLIGVALVTAAVLLMRPSVDLSSSTDLAQSWPLLIVVLAFAQMVATIKERHQQGWGLLLAGNWLLANTMTNWAYIQFSVPVLLAGLGVTAIIRSLRDHNENMDEEHRATH